MNKIFPLLIALIAFKSISAEVTISPLTNTQSSEIKVTQANTIENINYSNLLLTTYDFIKSIAVNKKSVDPIPNCESGTLSGSIHLIPTEHTVFYSKPKLCHPLPISDFSAIKGEHIWDYTLSWSKPVSYTHLTLPTICSV